MAIVTATTSNLQMGDPVNFSGLVNSVANGVGTATSFSTINMGFGGGVWQFAGAGFGGYVAGIPSTGTVTGVTYSGSSSASITGLSLPIATFFTFVDNGDQNGLYNFVFAGNDTITGSSFGDSLTGYGGSNAINGGDGDDVITTLGIDTIDGGAGIDSIFIDHSQISSPTALNLSGMATNAGITLANGTSIRNVEAFDVTTGSGNDTLTFSGALAGLNVFRGGAGADQLVLDLSSTTIAWQTGFDRVTTSFGSPVLFMFSVETFDITGGQAGDDLRGGIGSDVLSGGGGDDVIFGNFGDDTLDGGVGNDRIEGDRGTNMLLGGDGDDQIISGVLDGSGAVAVDNIDGGAGTDLLNLYYMSTTANLTLSTAAMRTNAGVALGDGTIIRNVERVFLVLFGTGADNLIVDSALTGNLSYVGGGGVDRLTADLASLSQGISLSQVNSKLDAGTFSVDFFTFAGPGAEEFYITGGSGDDALTGAARNDVFVGNGGADTLVGSGGDDLLNGGAGNDSLDGGAGADALIGGAGDDAYFVDTDLDIITELVGEGIDAVSASSTYFLFDNVENLTLTGVAAINGSGNALANVITGNDAVNQLFGFAGNDTLDGGAGADSLFGGVGDDLYIVDNAADFAFEGNVAWGVDLVQASVSYALGQNIDNLTLVGAALVGNGNLLANAITGNANANTLFGMAGNDTLNGAAGADQMFGGLGDDLYIVDDSADFTFEAQSAWGNDTVQTNVDYQLGQNIDNLVLQAGAGALIGRGNLLANTLTGNESANTLFGFAGNDTLDGGAGADQLYGREGDDAYIVDNVGDVVAEVNAAWGTDTIFASVTYFLSPNIEHLTLTGAGNINGNGNALNNTLTGNSGANTLSGQLGNDVLDGGAGADALFGGEGDDVYIVDNAGDVGFEANAAWGIDLVQSSVSHTLGTNLDNLTLTGAAAINATGNGLANTLTGNSAANQLFGLGGADTLNGGAGNDALDGGGGGDDGFVFAPGSGSDTVAGFIAGGAEDSINLSAYNGSGVTWTMAQSGADTIFAFSNGDQITLTNVTAANLVQTDPFGYS